MTHKHNPARIPMRKAVTASVQQRPPTAITYLETLLRDVGTAADRVSADKAHASGATTRNTNNEEVH